MASIEHLPAGTLPRRFAPSVQITKASGGVFVIAVCDRDPRVRMLYDNSAPDLASAERLAIEYADRLKVLVVQAVGCK